MYVQYETLRIRFPWISAKDFFAKLTYAICSMENQDRATKNFSILMQSRLWNTQINPFAPLAFKDNSEKHVPAWEEINPSAAVLQAQAIATADKKQVQSIEEKMENRVILPHLPASKAAKVGIATASKASGIIGSRNVSTTMSSLDINAKHAFEAGTKSVISRRQRDGIIPRKLDEDWKFIQSIAQRKNSGSESEFDDLQPEVFILEFHCFEDFMCFLLCAKFVFVRVRSFQQSPDRVGVDTGLSAMRKEYHRLLLEEMLKYAEAHGYPASLDEGSSDVADGDWDDGGQVGADGAAAAWSRQAPTSSRGQLRLVRDIERALDGRSSKTRPLTAGLLRRRPPSALVAPKLEGHGGEKMVIVPVALLDGLERTVRGLLAEEDRMGA